jgi:LacI family transcriptional regulator
VEAGIAADDSLTVAVPVTVVAYDPADLGRRAGELLARRLAGDDRPRQRVVLPTTLIARGAGKVML